MALFEIHNLSAGYENLRVLRDVDLNVEGGSIAAVLGPNGAGKTTLLKACAGWLTRSGGEVRVDGAVLPAGKPVAASKAGIALVPEGRALFTTLSVDENMAVARRSGGPAIADMLELFPNLQPRRRVAAGNLSGGEQQVLSIARALVQRPRVLLIDEMSTGLAPTIVESLLPILRRVADETGAAIVLVEQHVRLALEVADHAVILVHGEVMLRGESERLAAMPEDLEAAYLGTPVPTPADSVAGRH